MRYTAAASMAMMFRCVATSRRHAEPFRDATLYQVKLFGGYWPGSALKRVECGDPSRTASDRAGGQDVFEVCNQRMCLRAAAAAALGLVELLI